MSAFGGKADIERNPSECLLMTQSGHLINHKMWTDFLLFLPDQKFFACIVIAFPPVG
jgi:hypothetical protein